MSSKKIELISLDEAATIDYVRTTLPYSADPKSLSLPFLAAHAAVDWAWVQWQIKPDFLPISEHLTAVTRRTAVKDAAEICEKRRLLGYYEYFLLNCAVLSGDWETMRLAGAATKGADIASSQGQYYQSLAGILRARINGDRGQEQQQLEVLERSKADKVHPTPSNALLQAFVKRDYKALDREVAKGAKRFWKDSFLGRKVIVKDEPDHMVIDVTKKHAHYSWAYAEAVIAKLAILDGATVTYDDLWFPLELVKAMRTSSPAA